MRFQICYNLEMEWRQIENSDYDVSDDGQVRSRKHDPPRILRGGGNRYKMVMLRIGGKSVAKNIHSLVAIAFSRMDSVSGKEVNHINGDKKDNRSDNLEYVSHKDNLLHARDTLGRWGGPREKPNKAQKSRTGLTDEDFKLIESEISSGKTHRSIAEKMGVSHTTIGNIARKKLKYLK